jgi:hypothetical protein
MLQGRILDGHMSLSMCQKMLKSMNGSISYMFVSTDIFMILIITCLTFLRHWSRHTPEGAALEAEWNAKFAEYEKKYKEEAAELKAIINRELPADWEKALPVSKVSYFLVSIDFVLRYLFCSCLILLLNFDCF